MAWPVHLSSLSSENNGAIPGKIGGHFPIKIFENEISVQSSNETSAPFGL